MDNTEHCFLLSVTVCRKLFYHDFIAKMYNERCGIGRSEQYLEANCAQFLYIIKESGSNAFRTNANKQCTGILSNFHLTYDQIFFKNYIFC